jgi:hypothetical protein
MKHQIVEWINNHTHEKRFIMSRLILIGTYPEAEVLKKACAGRSFAGELPSKAFKGAVLTVDLNGEVPLV